MVDRLARFALVFALLNTSCGSGDTESGPPEAFTEDDVLAEAAGAPLVHVPQAGGAPAGDALAGRAADGSAAGDEVDAGAGGLGEPGNAAGGRGGNVGGTGGSSGGTAGSNEGGSGGQVPVPPRPLRILVVYTAASRTRAGSPSALADTVDTAMEQLNTALKMSEIDGTAEIAGVQEVDYAESGNISIDLHNLKSDFDDHLDEAHALRAEYQADLVSLWVDYKEYAGETSIKSSFSTVSTRYAVSNLSFAHEIGHTLGCYHDRYNMTYLPHASAYGYRFHGKSGGHYRTLMAYHPGERIPRFSNPAVLFDGVPTGIIEPEPDAADCAARVRASWDQMSSRFEDYVQ